MKTLIKNGRVIDPASNTDEIKDILFEDGIILKVEKDINDNADVEQTIIDPKDGQSIVTTLDVGVQQIVEKYGVQAAVVEQK